MAQRGNLYRRPSGIYVLRITVPVRYRALIGQREIHASTRTTHLVNARAIAARLLEKWYASLEEFRQVETHCTLLASGSCLVVTQVKQKRQVYF